MKVAVVTLFPELVDPPLAHSIPGRAREAGHWELMCISPREYATGKHRSVDEPPSGGGAGMVMRATELAASVHAAWDAIGPAPVILLSPQGRPFSQEVAAHLATLPALVFVCGRYEGVDERFVQRYVDAEISLGDFVLSGGEPAAVCVIDATLRLLPGVLGNRDSADEESFASDRLEYPQFTRPQRFEGREIPPVLTSGDHSRVRAWRLRCAAMRTATRRPDLLARRALSAAEADAMADASLPVEAELLRMRDPLLLDRAPAPARARRLRKSRAEGPDE